MTFNLSPSLSRRTSMLAALLCLLPAAAAQDTRPADAERSPEQRAAFAAEYERDYAKAVRLLDEEIADMTRIRTPEHPSVRRLVAQRERYQELAAAANASTTQPADGLLLRYRAWFAEAATPTAQWQPLADRVKLFGAPFVPFLERALLEGRVAFENTVFEPAPWHVARALAEIGGPSARAALRRAAAAPDPVAGAAALAHLHPVDDRDLLAAALESEAPRFREAATAALINAAGDDDRAAALLVGALRRGEPKAAYWLANHRRAEAIRHLMDPATPNVARIYLGQELSDRLTAEQVEVIADGLERIDGEAAVIVLRSLPAKGNDLSGRARNPLGELSPSVAAKIEAKLLRLIETWDDRKGAVGRLWGEIAGAASTPLLEKAVRGPESAFRRAAHDAASGYKRRLGEAPWATLRAALAGVPEEAFADDRDPVNSPTLSVVRTKPAATSDLVETFHESSESIRPWLIRNLIRPRLLEALGLTSGGLSTGQITKTIDEKFHTSWKPVARLLLDVATADPAYESDAHAAFAVLRFAPDRDTLAAAIRLGDRPTVFAYAKAFPTEVRAALQAAVLSDSEAEAERALTRLGALPTTEALHVFEAAWTHRGNRATAPFASALLSIVGPAASERLRALVEDVGVESLDPSILTRIVDRFGLELFHDGLPVLQRALTHPYSSVRHSAQQAFKTFKENREALEEISQWTDGARQKQRSIDDLLKMLDHPEPEVVRGAVKALGALKAKAALPRLVPLLARNDPELRQAVNDAIGRIGE
ncbi:MAG TPA: HEAT repeat domain-containing protein [Planctomycetota bacterium]|nr:HEAT repeat domain-containing protein [Planctomycetota bacterium]